MMMVLVFLPFFLSMVVTNDVSLITFVPFALVVLRMAGWERLIVPTVILQTIAANLGSMLTPMGNPQNLYLYAQSGMGFDELVMLTLAVRGGSGVALAVVIGVGLRHPKPVQGVSVDVHICRRRSLVGCTGGFVLCLLAIFGLVPPWAIAALAAVTLLVVNRRVLASVDYSLLATFVAFFIFIGNMGNIGPFREMLASVLEGRVEIVSVLASQIVSKRAGRPAAVGVHRRLVGADRRMQPGRSGHVDRLDGQPDLLQDGGARIPAAPRSLPAVVHHRQCGALGAAADDLRRAVKRRGPY